MASIIRSPVLSKDARKLVSPRVSETEELLHESELSEDAFLYDEDSSHEAKAVEESVQELNNDEPVESIDYEAKCYELQLDLDKALSRAKTAEESLESLSAELETAKKETEKQGYDEGYEAAKQAVDQEVEELLSALRQLVKNISSECQSIIEEAEEDLLEAVYAASARVIGSELVRPESVATMVQDVAKQIVDAKELTIKLSSSDYKMINEHGLTLFSETGNASKIRVIADPSVEMGGCILETEKGSLDARLEVQMQRLKQVLLDNHTRQKQQAEAAKNAE